MTIIMTAVGVYNWKAALLFGNSCSNEDILSLILINCPMWLCTHTHTHTRFLSLTVLVARNDSRKFQFVCLLFFFVCFFNLSIFQQRNEISQSCYKKKGLIYRRSKTNIWNEPRCKTEGQAVLLKGREPVKRTKWEREHLYYTVLHDVSPNSLI